MMLCYKAWLETRSRFLIALLGMTAFGAWRMWDLNRMVPSSTYAPYFYFNFRSVHNLLNLMLVLAITLLFMGGLLQEKASGPVLFTLALPVSRARLMNARITVGLLESAALLAIPWTAICITGILTSPVRPGSLALFYAMITAAGAAAVAGVSLIASTLVEGAYTAPTVVLGVILLCANAPKSWASVFPFELMSGQAYLDHSNMFVGPWPWGRTAAFMAASAVLIWIAVKIMERKDF
jgi:ABC-2 type transport system permease protein